MKKNLSLFFTSLLLLSLVLAISVSGCETNSNFLAQQEKITKTFNVKAGQLLYLKSDLGSVKVETWNRNEVKVDVILKEGTSKREAERFFENFDVKFDSDSRGVQVYGEYTGSKRWLSGRNRVNVHFEIMVPREFDLDINTAGGSIKVSDLTGKMDLNTSGGSISAGNVEGPVKANTSGGSITVGNAKGDVDVRTSGGSISIGETTGSVYANTSGGGITLERVTGDAEAYTSGGSLNFNEVNGNVNGKTSGGSIYAKVTGKIDEDCTLKTSGGSIRLYLPDNTSANIDAHTSGGRVTTDFPVTVKGVIKKNSLNGKINNGGPLIYLRTSGGSISISEL